MSRPEPSLSGRVYRSPEDLTLSVQQSFGSEHALRQELTLFDGVCIVVGTIVGSGIFLIPSSIASHLTSLSNVLLVWAVGGILTMFGALSLAELGSMYPGTGGLCTYLEHAYGPLAAFLYAWSLLLMIHSGSIAALAVAFGLYIREILPLNLIEAKLFSVMIILTLTAVNCLGIRSGKLVQNLIATAKVSGLTAMILLLGLRGSRPLRCFERTTVKGDHAFSLTGFGLALIAVLWAYEAWHVLSFAAGEMKKPRRDLPLSLFYGVAIVVVVFLVANLAYYHVLSPAEIRGSDSVAALAVGKVFGPAATTVISVLILVSITGSMNGMILTGPRVYHAMGDHNIFPRVFGQINGRYRTPILALIVQGVWSCVLVASGSYEQLFTEVIFTAWIFYGLAVAAVLVLRRLNPQLKRPFHVPGYPWVPVLFCLAALTLVLNTLIEKPGGALLGFGLVCTGIPIYCVGTKRHHKKTNEYTR